MDSFSEQTYETGLDYEDKPLAGNIGRLEELLEEGEAFDVWYRDSGDRIGSETQEEKGLRSLDAVDLLLSQASSFDRYMVTWSSFGEIDKVRVYENIREGFLGRFLPKRGDEMIFEYREE